MPTYIKRLKLGQRKREVLIAYLFGEISQYEACKAFNVKRQNFPSITNNVLRALVMEGRIDIGKLLQDF